VKQKYLDYFLILIISFFAHTNFIFCMKVDPRYAQKTSNKKQLFYAIEKGDFLKVEEILKSQPALVHARDMHNDTPLHCTVKNSYTTICCYNIFQILYKEGPKIVENEKVFTQILQLLLDAGNEKVKKKYFKAEAIRNNSPKNSNIEIAKLLIAYGAPIYAVGKDGTPLEKAKKMGNLNMVNFFLQKQRETL